MLGNTIFATVTIFALCYTLFHIFRYIFFYPEKVQIGKVKYVKRSDSRFMAFLPQKKVRLYNHESEKISSLPYYEYTEVK